MARKKKCKSRDCGKWFYTLPDLPDASVCSPECGLLYGRELRLKADDKAHRARKKAIKPISKHLAETQAIFNKFIRLRDELLPCVSCGRFHEGQYHAGHFQPRSTHSRMRFSEFNVQKQCAPCNNHKSGNLILFREELARRIGETMVEWLEAPEQREPIKWTIDDCDNLKKHYRDKIKDLEAVSVVNVPF